MGEIGIFKLQGPEPYTIIMYLNIYPSGRLSFETPYDYYYFNSFTTNDYLPLLFKHKL